MKILRIFDVSAFVHAGMVNKHAMLLPSLEDTPDFFRERRIYAGGASLIWNTLYYEYGKCDMVFCCDRYPTIKQGMFSDYKCTRQHKPEVSKSKEVCERILSDCGFTVLAEDGYEADDFIYSLVRDMRTVYDHIYIYTADSDLYFLVSDNVSVLPSSSRAKTVTKQNYTYTVRPKEYTPYNALTFYKMLDGDKSDDIPPLHDVYRRSLREVFDKKLYHPFLGDKEFVTESMSSINPDIANRISLIFPLDIRVPQTFGKGDKLRIADWGNAFKNKLWRNDQRIPDYIQDSIEDMANCGLYAEND